MSSPTSPRDDADFRPTRSEERLMRMVTGVVQQLQSLQTPTTPTTPTFMATLERDVKWADVKPYPGLCDRLDAWFAAFERKLKTSKLSEDHWGQRFFECPKVGDELKRVLSDAGRTSYAEIRGFLLDRDGPLDPLGFFRSEIHRVTGTTRREVCSKLTDLLALYNRAARDAGKETWSERDLIYPFINAFPASVGKHIRESLKLALLQPDPFMIIVDRAPETSETPQDEEPALLTAVTETRITKRPRPEDADLIASIEGLRKDLRTRDQTGPRRTRERICIRCGGTPHTAALCPARDRTCRNCQKIGHYASQCRTQTADRDDPRNNTRNSNSQPIGRRPFRSTFPDKRVV